MGAHIPERYRAYTNNCTLLIRELKCQSGEIFPFTEANQWTVAYGKNTALRDTFSLQYYHTLFQQVVVLSQPYTREGKFKNQQQQVFSHTCTHTPPPPN